MADPSVDGEEGRTPGTRAPRWLDESEQHIWRTYLWTNRLLFDALDRQLRRDSGMPHAYYMILAMLSESPDRRLTMSALAALVRSSPSRLSHAVARLEEAGWVTRGKATGDRRTTYATLTDAGWEVLVEAAPGHVEAVRTYLFDPLTPQQVQALGEIVDAMHDRLGADGFAEPG